MKTKKILIAVAGGCTLAGIILMGAGILMGGSTELYIDKSGFHAKSNKGYHMEKTAIDKFESMDISADYADVRIIPSDGYYLEYHLSGNSVEPYYNMGNNKLTFKESPENKFFIGLWNWGALDSEEEYYVNVYVPEDIYFQTVKIYNDSGDTECENLSGEKIKIQGDYGDISIGNITGGTISLVMDSGDLDISKLEARTLELENEYGDVVLEKSTAEKAEITIDSGDLILKDADYKKVKAELDYGDAEITLAGNMQDYDWNLYTDYGSIRLPGAQSIKDDGEEFYEIREGKERFMEIYCDSGDISIMER